MEYIPNQPVYFQASDAEAPCSVDEVSYSQIVDNTDKTQFQLKVGPCISALQELPNPDFDNQSDENQGWQFLTNWSVGGGTLCAVQSEDFAKTIDEIEEGYWKITLSVESINGSIDVLLNAETIGTITTVGTFDFYGFIGVGGGYITLNPNSITDVCFTSITAYKVLTNLIVPIYTSAGVYVTEINYNDNPEYFKFVSDSVTVSVDWAELGISNGCFYLCYLDPCVNKNGQNYPAKILNGGFTGNIVNWENSGSWVYGTNDVTGTYSGVDNSNSLTQENVFVSFNNQYCINVNVTAISGSLDVYFGNSKVATITTVGVHNVCGIPSGTFQLLFVIASGTATITNVEAVEIEPVDYVCDATSKLMKLGDFTNDCTLLINACNNSDAMGFVFSGSTFSPRIRVEAKLRHSKYETDVLRYTNSAGKKSNYNYSSRKQKNLAIELQPEYVHDFLRLLLGFDNVFIDNVAYVVDDDEYNVLYVPELDTYGSVSILVSQQTQNVKNTLCSDTQINCNLAE